MKRPNIENTSLSSQINQVEKVGESNSINIPTPKVKENDEILCCEGCGCYGMSGEFFNTEACSVACQVFY